MKYSVSAHKVIAVVSLLTLSCVQFFLLYNTYELKNDHYYLAEKGIITADYIAAIKNDKVMPGGGEIVDRYMMANMAALEAAYGRDRVGGRGGREFGRLSQLVCDSVFRDLKRAYNIDSLLGAIVSRHHLDPKIRYASTIESLQIAFQRDQYIPIYQEGGNYPLIDSALQTKDGIRLGGTLEGLRVNNLAKNITVSSSVDHSYLISFSLYVDSFDRKSRILRLMMPAFLLSFLSVASVVLLYFITFRNWQRQKKLSEMKSDFINSISHEFHTPLSAIIVANRTMQNEKILASRESLLPLTEVVQRQAERLKTLIGQALRITTMNKLTLKPELLSVNHLLDELLLDYRLQTTEAAITLTLYEKALKDEVLVDPFWFATIILNLIDNAVKYNDKESKEIVVTTFSDRRALHIAIEDNGIGIPRDVQRHMFEKFYRGGVGVGSGVKGLGLGLFYVKQAVDSHSWKIELNSVAGRGSVFTISIPF
jgi:two-component system phosphate regulon sensor histidine kinase PhoR